MTAPWCMALIDLPVPTTTSRDTSKRTASRPMRSCSDIASSPSSAISPSTAQLRRSAARPAGSAAGHPGQRLQPGPHRVGVGVVGVVDDGDAVGAGAHLPSGAGTPGRPPPAPRPPARGWPRTPARPRPRTARWTPDGRRAPPASTSDSPPPACSVNAGRASSSSVTSLGPDVGARPAAADPHHPGGASGPPSPPPPASSTLRTTTRTPEPLAAVRLSSSAMASREPNSPRCAVPTLSTTAIDGGAMAASAAMLPGWRADISRIR